MKNFNVNSSHFSCSFILIRFQKSVFFPHTICQRPSLYTGPTCSVSEIGVARGGGGCLRTRTTCKYYAPPFFFLSVVADNKRVLQIDVHDEGY